ncbi:MAG: RadC family protein [Clostridia bacterium]|nr:RadC family protein [Clostridia bacterium]
MATHDGHRDRLREKILTAGIESLQPHEILEYLLFAFIPRKDTNEIAHELINSFGTFSDVLSTDVDRLLTVKGMTRNAALFLNSLPEVLRVYSVESNKEKTSLKGRGVARDFMRAQLYGKDVEVVYMAAVDAKDNFIRIEKLSRGTGQGVRVSVRDMVDFAIRTKACGVLLAHNHPSGDIAPSGQDVAVTSEIYYLLSGIGVKLQDHFIFSENKYYSFEENGILPQK